MAPQLGNYVLETATAPGTGSFTLNGPETDRRSFSAAFPNGGSVFYFADDGSSAEWGVGTLTIGTPSTLSRTTIIGTTSGGTSVLNFPSSVEVYNEIPAEYVPILEADGHLIVKSVTDWTKYQAVGAADADARFVNAGGDVMSGTLTTRGAIQAGVGGGWDRPSVIRQIRFSAGTIQFGNPANAANNPYFGQWLISDVMGDPGNDLSGPAMAANNFNAQQFFYTFAWNGNITTPKGKVAFLSDLSAYQPVSSCVLNSGGTNMQAGHTIRIGWPDDASIKQTGARALLHVDDTYFGPLALYSDVTALQAVVNGKQQAGNYALLSQLPTDPNKIILAWNGSVGAGDQTIPFPRGVSSVDTVVVSSRRVNAATVLNVQGWNNTSVQVHAAWFDGRGAGDTGTDYRAILIGNK
ncbi:hypothetical protein [Acetobacter malorum]|uniref:hypothetical protein n=1 Tax=Acetobacter malorum TaxID=178901 RepID=UPI000777A45C|nr:hypothetical protein [Acetobacter malorum]